MKKDTIVGKTDITINGKSDIIVTTNTRLDIIVKDTILI